MRRRTTLTAIGAVLAGIGLSACGSSSLSSPAPTSTSSVSTSVDQAAAALVPAALKSKGTLTVASDASYAPSEFLAGDGSTIEGFDVDLFKAVAGTLGLKAQFQNADFGSIISGVNSQKYDIGVSSFTINPDREKVVNMVSYFNAGTLWATATGNPKSVNPSAPCGLNIAVQSNTVQQDDIAAKAKKCAAQGKPVHVDAFDRQDQATAAVVSGKDDAMLADSPVVAYAVKQSNGKLAPAGNIYASAPYGYAIAKNDTGLAKAIAAALKDVEASGAYKQILDTWGVSQGAVTTFEVNPSVQ